MKPGSHVTVVAHGICRMTNPIVESDRPEDEVQNLDKM